VALLDGPAPCGTTAANELVCLEGDRTRVLMTGVRQVVGKSSEHQCALDGAGAVFCRGANHTGQCGVSVGLFRSDEPVEVALR
jgi:alpha-tubulin suppressor-like RCC1 family protein